LSPRLNFYRGRPEPVPTPAVRSRVSNDLYLNLMAFDRAGSHATLSVMVQPLVSWIWAGGVLVAMGALIGVLPLQKKQRRRKQAAAREAVAA
jgi:cytochrome c-type biogenesis protein CcmF